MTKSLQADLLERYSAQHRMTLSSNRSKEPQPWDCGLISANTAFLKGVVRRYGWPTISEIGREAAQAAWQLLQYADDEPDFQKTCLAMIKSLPENEIEKRNIAYLEDRVRVREGRLQLYGTQHWSSLAIEDRHGLDERRRAMGLSPYADELQLIKDLDRRD